MTGRLYAVVGPSGAGKDTLMQAARDRLDHVDLVRRVITRPTAAGGEDFEGVSEAEFAERLARGAFALQWQAHGLCYGIPTTVREALSRDRVLLFNGSRAMLADAARAFPGLQVIHVTASDAVLSERLRARGRETTQDIAQRLARARLPLPEDLTVTTIDNSGPLEQALTALLQTLTSETVQA